MSGDLDEGARVIAKEASRGFSVAGVTDPEVYLYAYYRHMDVADLDQAGPQRAAATAAEHARLAARRPQGRALVAVRDGGEAALLAGRDVIDVVTDDMPFLVESVMMTLDRHGLAADLVVHPQLLVRRDMSGALLDVLGKIDQARQPGSDSGHDVIAESWTHLEVAAIAPDAVQAVADDLQQVLGDVRMAVEDYPRMRARAEQLADELAAEAPGEQQAPEPESLTEIEALLRWLTGHFSFLGYREYDFIDDADGMRLTSVPGTGLGILRFDKTEPTSLDNLPEQARAWIRGPQRLILTKANSRATVHRPSYLDYVGVKKVSADGEVVGEYRFLGLFTHLAYSDTITRIPVLRRKLTAVLQYCGLSIAGHDGREVSEFMESYPREELFQTPVAELATIATALVRLRERPRTRLFLRKDIYGRYVSCLIYLTRDRYTTKVRLEVQDILRRALNGSQLDYSAMVGESPIARLHIVIRAERGQLLADADQAELEAEVAAAVRSWDDDLASQAAADLGDAAARSLLAMLANAIPENYKTDVPPSAALSDLFKVKQMREAGKDIAFEMWESADYTGGVPLEDDPEIGDPAATAPEGRVWRLTIYRTGAPITLTDVLPRLQHMGVEVVDEHPYEFSTAKPFWLYDFGLKAEHDGQSVPLTPVAEQLEGALAALWSGDIEDDGFNALVLDAHLSWRQVVVLRAYAKYLRQAGVTFSQDYIIGVLRANVVATRLLVRLFESRFDPDHLGGQAERSEALVEEISGELDDVAILDHDRILRAYLGLITATIRTSYFQHERDNGQAPYLVFKLAAEQVPDLPAPRPKFEIFVYSPRFEAVHLRFAGVARGGLRWSDRREDFRTEILGLAKAQEVKNAVIVPSGAKGGFVCKQLPDASDREAYLGEVRSCYRMFITAMLDITDNLVDSRVVAPDRVVRHDGDDVYLVVAADKGTATFSDTANEIALRRGFWLGDAFASGGSAGYDHKKMGITARGAWESVKFHFSTVGTDVDRADFTVVGIGDMSGDVFGNGMLLSQHIKLVAAFDHRHIFLDPDPDPQLSFAERERLFKLPRSSWADYDAARIGSGGGVWPRSVKSVPISRQAAAALGLDGSTTAMAPDQVISAILAAPVDLLWNGGIGTYIKASTQVHADAGDRANDAVRIDASELRAKVVGEGGNLGLTQEARIEFARAGGLVNTDFIDNSAGVDTSDHEVNIKILLDQVIRAGGLKPAARNELLHEMTDEVGALVLQHNYHQNRALAGARAQGAQMLHVHARYIHKLERDGRVRRRLDVLPGTKELAERRSAGSGLTLPEFSVLLAHTKIAATSDMLASALPDDPYLRRVLTGYFPAQLQQRYADRMTAHRLRREIITTAVVNDMVDRSGITFAFRLNEETGASVADITAAWLVSRDVFDMAGFWRALEALDSKVETATQTLALLEGRKLTERAARWLLHFRRPPFDIQATVEYFADGVLTVGAGLPKLLAGSDLASFEERRDAFTIRGVPDDLAERIAGMVPAYAAFDIVEIAKTTGLSVEGTAEVYFDLAERLQITRLRDRITALPRDDRWNTMARGALRDDLYTAHAALTRDVLTVTEGGTPEERLMAWVRRNESAVTRAAQTLAEIWDSDAFTVATLSVAVRAIRTLVAASTLPA